MTITFKSIENDQICYVFEHDSSIGQSYWNQPSQFVHSCAHQYDTYGDGAVQHSMSYRVPRRQFLDYWGSLAYHLRDNPDDIPNIEKWFHGKGSKDEIIFLSTVKHKEGKTKYFSMHFQKVTTAPSKQYDNRWKEVPKNADGSIVSIYNLLADNYWSFTDRVRCLKRIRTILAERTGSWGWLCYEEILGIGVENTDKQALQAIEAFCQSYREMENAKNTVSCLGNNWLRNKLGKTA